MASKHPTQPGEVPDWGSVTFCIDQLFSSRPPKYFAVNKACSNSTRPPQFFDLHLKEELRLKKLVLAEDLPQFLGNDCLRKIDERKKSGSFPQSPLDPKALDDAIFPSDHLKEFTISKEDHIRDDYGRRTINPCLSLASAIAFGQTQWSEDAHHLPFEWIVNTSINRSNAQCDGHVSVRDHVRSRGFTPDGGKTISLIHEHHLQNIVLYEHKNPVAGDFAALNAITQLASENGEFFEWITCGTFHFAKEHKCTSNRHTPFVQTGRKTGPDTQDTTLYDRLPKFRTVPSGGIAQSRSSPHDNVPTHWQTTYEKPYYMLHQLWSELVHEDATFGVLSSGEYEIVVMRHRESKTLYLSHVNEVASTNSEHLGPALYHLHTALALAAYFDCESRALQLDALLTVDPCAWWLKVYQTKYESDSRRYKKAPRKITPAQPKAGKTSVHVQRKRAPTNAEARMTIFEELQNAQTVQIVDNDNTISIQYSRLNDEDFQATSHDVQSLTSTPDIGDQTRNSTSAQVAGDLEVRLGKLLGGSKKVREAFLLKRGASIPANKKNTPKIVTKFNDTMYGIGELCNEARMYKELRVKGFDLLPIYFGLFVNADDGHVLILEHAGEPLDLTKRPTKTHAQRLESNTLKRLLQKIRAAGYLHRTMELGHVIAKWRVGRRDCRHVLVGLKGVISVEELHRKDGEHVQQYIDLLDAAQEKSDGPLEELDSALGELDWASEQMHFTCEETDQGETDSVCGETDSIFKETDPTFDEGIY